MIAYKTLTNLVLRALKADCEQRPPRISQLGDLITNVEQLAAQEKVLLNSVDEDNISQVVWDLVVNRVLTVGLNRNNHQWPFFRLTEFGRSVVCATGPSLYDAEGYLTTLESFVPELDSTIKQYALEAVNCHKLNLFFAAAVMLGAAAEKAILLLLEAIGRAESNSSKKKEIEKLLERPRLPEVFGTIQQAVTKAIQSSALPYSIHQGSIEHLLSLYEMIRVQRNEAVHPVASQVNKDKIFLALQSLPEALKTTFGLVNWFNEKAALVTSDSQKTKGDTRAR